VVLGVTIRYNPLQVLQSVTSVAMRALPSLLSVTRRLRSGNPPLVYAIVNKRDEVREVLLASLKPGQNGRDGASDDMSTLTSGTRGVAQQRRGPGALHARAGGRVLSDIRMQYSGAGLSDISTQYSSQG
jgi:hypothetical protein